MKGNLLLLANEEYKRLAENLPADVLGDNRKFFRGKGCKSCNNTGYKGRIVIAEVLVADEEIRAAILRKGSASEIKQLAIKNGMTVMFVDGFHKAAQGLTTIEEILRVIHE